MAAIYKDEVQRNYADDNEAISILKRDDISRLLGQSNRRNSRGEIETAKDVLKDMYSKLDQSKISGNFKKSFSDMVQGINKIKSKDTVDGSEDLKKALAIYEESIHKDISLSNSEKDILYKTTISLSTNADNVEALANQFQKSGRCWFCSIVNAIVTIAVFAVAVVVIAALAVTLVAGAAAFTVGMALWFGGAGAVGGVISVANDDCWQVWNYGQSPPYQTIFGFFDIGSC
ncbi:hypothetical protein [Fibrella arboris]|uniref:hypothetical protein n=1 Tax=Fibrella arboris TaxID=3242486 RepID=UPI0035216839